MVYAVDIETYFQPARTFTGFGSLISVLLPNLYILAGLIFFVLLIFGGLGLIMGAGGGDPKKTEQGGKAVTYAIVGFLVVFASYWIIQIIQVVTGVNILNSPL